MNLKTIMQIAASWREGDDALDLMPFIMEGYPWTAEHAVFAMEQEMLNTVRMLHELQFTLTCMEHENPMVQALGHRQYEVAMESIGASAEASLLRIKGAAEKIRKIIQVVYQFITKYFDIVRRWADQYFSFTAGHKRHLEELAEMARGVSITNEGELSSIYHKFPKQVAYAAVKLNERWEIHPAEQVTRVVSNLASGIGPDKIHKAFNQLPKLITSFTTQPVEKSRADMNAFRDNLISELRDYMSNGQPSAFTSSTTEKGDNLSFTHPIQLGNMAYRITYRKESLAAPTTNLVHVVDQKDLRNPISANPVTPEYAAKVSDTAAEALGKLVAGRAGYDTARLFAENMEDAMKELENRLSKTELSPELSAFFKEVVEAMPSYLSLYHSCFKVQADAIYNWAMGLINIVVASKPYWKQQ